MLVLHRHSIVVYCQAEAGCFGAGRGSPEDPTYNRDADADSHRSRDMVTEQIVLLRAVSHEVAISSLTPVRWLLLTYSSFSSQYRA